MATIVSKSAKKKQQKRKLYMDLIDKSHTELLNEEEKEYIENYNIKQHKKNQTKYMKQKLTQRANNFIIKINSEKETILENIHVVYSNIKKIESILEPLNKAIKMTEDYLYLGEEIHIVNINLRLYLNNNLIILNEHKIILNNINKLFKYIEIINEKSNLIENFYKANVILSDELFISNFMILNMSDKLVDDLCTLLNN